MTEQHIALELEQKSVGVEHRNGHLTNAGVDIVDGKNNRVPRAVPEFEEDDEDDDRPLSTDPQSGIDDGFLTPNDSDPKEDNERGSQPRNRNNKPRPRRPSFAFPGYDGPGYVEVNGVQTPIPDVNAYQHKKTLAQGMMDLALLSANANQLRYVLETYKRHPYYYPSLIFISLSIIFQIAVGVGLILNGRYNIKNEKEICRANKINNYTVIGIFIVTVVNVFISAFGVADPAGDT